MQSWTLSKGRVFPVVICIVLGRSLFLAASLDEEAAEEQYQKALDIRCAVKLICHFTTFQCLLVNDK
jgi:hypothetical protein